VLVRATQTKNDSTAQQDRDEIFVAANLPIEVDPPSAAASFRDRRLLLMIKKAKPGLTLDNLTI